MAGGTLGGGDEDGAMIADINVTPLVDVTLVLLVIFMVAAPMLSEPTAIQVDLPKGKTGEATVAQEKGFTLLVGKEGRIQIRGQDVAMDQLAARLKEESVLRPDLEVGIAADKGASYGTVMDVLDTIRGAGISRFSLQMDDAGGGAAAAAAAAGLGAVPVVDGAATTVPAAAPGAQAAPAAAPLPPAPSGP